MFQFKHTYKFQETTLEIYILVVCLLNVPFVDRIPHQIDGRYIASYAECCNEIRKPQCRILGILALAMASPQNGVSALLLIMWREQGVHSHKPYRETHRFSACSRSRFLKSRYRLISFASSVKTTPATN